MKSRSLICLMFMCLSAGSLTPSARAEPAAVSPQGNAFETFHLYNDSNRSISDVDRLRSDERVKPAVIFRLGYLKGEALPSQFEFLAEKIGQRFFQRDVDLYVSFFNESALTNFAKQAEKIYRKESSDDQMTNYQHGIQVVASTVTEKQIRVAVLYSQDHFALSDQGVNQNLVKFIIDNADQNNIWYSRLEGGWQKLNGNHGTLIEGFMGLQKTFKRGSHELSASTEAGGVYVQSLVKDPDASAGFLKANRTRYEWHSSADYTYTIGKYHYRLEAGYGRVQKLRSDLQNPYFDVSVGGQQWSLGIRNDYYKGQPAYFNEELAVEESEAGSEFEPYVILYLKYRMPIE